MKKKFKFISTTLIIVVVTALLFLGVSLANSFIRNIQKSSTKAEYKEITEEDFNTQSPNVKFMAYFVKDDKQVSTTENRIGYSDNIYFDLKLASGTLKNAKIIINSQNFYLDTNLMEDSVISTDYISTNTKEIDLKEISGNINKTITGAVKSGNYEFPTSKAEAIGNDLSNYSKESTIVFSADYVDENNNTTSISKEITIQVNWYGSINMEIPNEVYGNANLSQKYNINNFLDEDNGEMTLEFKVATQETENEVSIKKSYVEGVIPLINDIAPTNVTVEGENINYTYDKDTQKFTAEREAVLSGNTITEEAYSGIYAQNEINYRYNEYTIKATYPIDAYLVDDDEYLEMTVPVKGHYEGFNGEKSEDLTANLSIVYSNMDNTTTGFKAFIGRNVLYPVERQIVSKRNVLLAYKYNNNTSLSAQIESDYYTRWNIVTKNGEKLDKAVLTDDNTKDVFVNNLGAEIANNDYISNKGIAFSNPVSALGEDGWIEVYNDETDTLIHKFTIDDWSNYDTLNSYEYSENVNYIRVETSPVLENSMLTIYNIKSINTDKLKEDFTLEEVKNITQIKTHFKGNMQISDQITEYATEGSAYFEDETSIINFTTSKNDLSTQNSNNLQLEISANMSQYNSSIWTDEEYLIKLPAEIINLTINSITTDNQEDSRINEYYQYKDNGNIFIKIKMSGESFESYRLLLDCTVETNPTSESKIAEVELYTYNNENNNYYISDQAEDIYDVNNNDNTQEIVGKKVDTISIVQEDTLLTYQSTSDATSENETIYAPLTAIVENENRTATVDISLQNNKDVAIKNIKVLGTVPFTGNKYQLTGEDLGSTYDAEIVSDGIILPEELARYATIYYSTNVDVNDDTTDPTNNWTTNLDDYSNVKHFLIVFNRYEIEPAELLKISYQIRIPEQIEYNAISYSTHTVYYSEDEGTEETRKIIEVNKLGFMLTKRVDLDISVLSKENNSGVEGATFKLVELGTKQNVTLKETNSEGKVEFDKLFLERDYTLEQIGISDDYVRNEDLIKFRAYEENGQIKLNVSEGNLEYTLDQETKTVNANMHNEVRYDFELTNISNESTPIQSTFKLIADGKDIEQETNEEGKTVFVGLYPEKEYTLSQTYSKGYYIEDNSDITFKLTRGDSGLALQVISGNFANVGSIDKSATKPVLKQTIQNEKIPTYNLNVTLYESGKIIPLEDATYRITGGGIENGATYTTDAKGTFSVPDLYAHVDGKNVTGEYTLKEIEPTIGYALTQTDIKFIVSKNADTQELTLTVTNGTIREEYEIVDNNVNIGIENSIIFNITTRDGETVQLLPGVKLVIKELAIIDNQEVEIDPMDADGNILGETQMINGVPCQVFTTNKDGIIEEALRNGIYKIVKIEVPYGYHLEDDEADRTYYVGIGETRGADVEAQFREPLQLNGSGDSQPDDYYVAGRDDGMGLFYHRGSLSLINDNNEVVRTISSNQALQIIDDNGTFVVLESSRIVKYNDKLDVIATIDLTNGMEKFATTSDGGYVIVGNYSGTKTISGNLTSNGQSLSITSTRGYDGGFFQENTVDIFVVKVDANGKVSNLAGFGGAGAWREPGEDRATYVTVNNNGDYVISAHIESEEISGSMMASGSDISGTFDDCYFIMDSDTMKVSQIVTVGTTRGNIEATEGNAHRAFAGVDGGVYYVGQMSGTVTFSGSQTASGQAITVKSTGDTDAYAVKFNSEGKVEWAIAVGGTNTDHIYSAEYTPDGELLIGGDSNGGAITVDGSKTSSGISINTEPIGDSASTWRGIALKIDSRGRVVWANEFGYAQNEGIYAFAGFTGNSYVICGFDDADNNLNNGRSDVYIRVDEAEGRQEISEVKGIEITTNKERYNITTSVNGVGGTITGQDQEIFETIVHGENATKTITVTPNEGYEILAIKVNGEKIPFTTDENGIATIEPMQNITENKNIVAEFSNNTSKIIVHHYLVGTKTKVAEDDVYVGIVGEEYITSPKADLSGYELAMSDGEYIVDGEVYGTYGEYDKEITYYYQEKTSRLIVNYFIEGTNIALSPSQTFELEKGEAYNTEEPAYIPEEYELVAQPINKSGIIEESEIVVTYYYKLKPTYEYKIEYYYDNVVDDDLTVTGEAIENKVIDTYTPQLKEGYIFDRVENLPLTISTEKSNNIIKVYYKPREDLRYTVEYYYDGTKEDSTVYTSIKFGTVINEYEPREKEGYQLEKVEGTPLTIGVNEEQNVIKVYYTIRKDLYYTVHYYEENSTTEAAPDKEVGGNTYHALATETPIDIPGYTKVNDDPQNITIQVDESKNVITFYYIKHAQINQNTLTKTGTDTITKEDEKLEYTISYSGLISGYKGKATITIVDTLPYQIDTNNANLDGGTYDSGENTITWVENLDNIDTYTNGDLQLNITKTIQVAYTNIDYSNTTITNRVSGNIDLERTGQEIEIPEASKDTTTAFTKDVTVTKEWNHTNNIYGIPTQVEVQVKNGDEITRSQVINSSNKVGDNENVWSYTFTGFTKYDENGDEITYTVDETEVTPDDLKYYKKEIDGNTIKNTYIGPIISAKKEATTENGLNYVVEGEKITYTITIKNDGQIAKDVLVVDSIPEGTTFTENSIKINNEETEKISQDLTTGFTVNVPENGETTISFEVTVNDLEGDILTKQLSNTAYVDGKEVGPVINTVNKSDLKFWKEADPAVNSDVKENDIITYTITLDNSKGTAPTTALVKDSAPEGTIFEENSIKINNEATNKTISELTNGISVDLGAYETKTLSFKVRVNNLNDTDIITNTATVNDANTEPVTHRYVEPIISGSKELDTQNKLSYVVEGEKITYTITAKNDGNLAGKATIKDVIPEGTTFVANSIKINNGETTKTSDELKEGIEVDVPALGQTTLSFEVTVDELAENIFEKEISNTATVNETSTNTENITVNKPNVVASKEASPAGTDVKQGDIITYTIRLDNSKGTAPTTVTVKDTVPEGTTFAGNMKLDESPIDNIETDLINGIGVSIEPHQIRTLSFQVEVGDLDNGDQIENKANVEGKDTNTVTNRYVEPIISSQKESSIEEDRDYSLEGEIITYSIKLTNEGFLQGTALVKDEIPEGTTFVTGSVKENGAVRTYTADDLRNGINVNVPAGTENEDTVNPGTTTISFEVKVNTLDSGVFEKTISNTANVDGTDTNTVNNTVYKSNVIATKESSTDGEDVEKDDIITYTIKLDNTLGTAPDTVIVKDLAPIGTTFVPGTIKENNKETQYTEENLKNGISVNVGAHEVKTISFQVQVNDLENNTQIINTAEVNNKDTNAITNRYVEPIITQSKTVETEHKLDYVVEGETVKYTITVENSGFAAGTAIVKDTIQPGLTFKSESIQINNVPNSSYTENSLREGIQVDVPAGTQTDSGVDKGVTTVSFEATVDTLSQDVFEKIIPNTANVNGMNTNTVNIEVNKPNVVISKASDSENNADVKQGDVITYTITLDNSLGTAPTTVTLTDEIPAGTSFVEGTIKENNIVKSEYGQNDLESGIEVSLAPNELKTISFQVRVNDLEDTTSITNTAKVDDQNTNTITHRYVEPIISAEKSSTTENDLSYVVEGEKITYYIVVKNEGHLEGKATIKDVIPEGTTFVPNSIKVNDEGTSYTEQNLNEGVQVNVTALGQTTLSFDVTVNPLEGDTLVKELSNTATVNDEKVGPVTNTVNKSDLKFSKDSEPARNSDVKSGDTITYKITLDNSNGTAPTTAIVKDTVPAGTTFVDGSINITDTDTNYTVDQLNSGISIDIAAHETKVLSFTVKVNDLDNGTTISNIATINDVKTDEITHRYVEPIISGNKEVTSQNGLNYVVEGEIITYTITAKNDGFLAGKASIKDEIPDGASFVENSIKINEEETPNTAEELKNGIEVDVPALGQTTLSFKVRVNTLEEGTFEKTIENKALVNEKETNTVISTVNKANVIPSLSSNPTSEVDVKYQDEITYTITLDNSKGTAPTTVKVKDIIPNETTFKQNSIILKDRVTRYTQEELNNGIDVELSVHEVAKLTFTVIVNDLENAQTISNTATVDDNPTNTITHRYIESIITQNKEVETENQLNYVVEGEKITYTITVENAGFLAGKAIIKDIIPDGTSFVQGSIHINNEENPQLTSINLQNGIEVDIPAGTQVEDEVENGKTTLSFQVEVNSLAQGTYEKTIENKASVNDLETNTVTSTVNKPNVVISKESDKTGTDVKAGDIITYTIKLDNTLGTAPTSVVVKDAAPEETTFVDKSIKLDGETIENLETDLNNGISISIDPHEVRTLSFKVQVNDIENGTNISNTAKVDEKDTNTVTSRYVEPIISAQKAVTTEHSLDYVVEGEIITYTITAKNDGFLAGNASIKDEIPAGTTFVEDSIKVNNGETDYTQDNLEQGITLDVPEEGQTTLSFEVTVNELSKGIFEKTIENKALVNDEETNAVTNIVNKPNVVPSKTADPVSSSDVKEDDVITYKITLDNSLGTAPTTVKVQDTVPEGTTFVDGSINITYADSVENLSQETQSTLESGINVELAAHETKELSFQVRVNNLDNDELITNTAKVNGTDTQSVTHRYVEPVISSEKEATTENSLGYVIEDEKITYYITVKNDGDLTGNATIVDSIPEGTTFVDGSIKLNGADTEYNEQNLLEGIIEEVPARDEIVISFEVTVDHLEGDLLTKVLTNTATVNGTPTDSVNTTVNKSNVKFWKTASPSNTDVKEGDIITYTVTLDNTTGTAPATVTVKDDVPEGTTLVPGSIKVVGDNSTEDLSQDTMENLSEGINVTLEAYETKTLEFKVTVGNLENGVEIQNIATVNDVPTNTVENRYVEPIISANKTATTEHQLDYVVEGEKITYTITVQNSGYLAGKANIIDEISDKTTFVTGSVKVNNEVTEYTSNGLKDGITVDVPAEGTTIVSFAVTVNELEDGKLQDTITNTAKVNNVETNTVQHTVDKPNVIPSKEASPSTSDIKEGDIITYSIKLDNTTGTAPTSVVVKDKAPDGTTFIGNMTLDGEKIDNIESDLISGISVSIPAYTQRILTFQVQVNDNDNGMQIINTANVDGKDTNTVSYRYVEPIITASKESATEHQLDYVVEGEKITYTITVSNSGYLAGEANIIDEIPEGTTFVTGSVKVNNEVTQYSSNDLKNGITLSVPAEGTTIVSFDITVNDLQGETLQKDITNIATVNNVQTNSVVETVKKPHVSIKKEAVTSSGNTQVIVGDKITYTITLDNSIGTAPTTVKVQDNVPEGTTFVEDSIRVNNLDISYTLDNLINGIDIIIGAGETRTLTFQVEVQDLDNGQEIKNTAQVNGNNTNEVSNTYIEPIITGNKDITTQYGLKYVVEGEKVGYTITATNEGDLAKDIIIKDNVPEGTTLVENSITINNEKQEYTAEDLEAGIKVNVPERSKVIVRFVVTVGNDAKELINKANVDGVDTNETRIPVVSFAKSAEVIRQTTENIEQGRVTASDKIRYTITINNLGKENVETLTVKDSIPEGTKLSTVNDNGITNGNQEVTWNISNLQTETNAQVSYEVTVIYDSQDTKEIKNTATVDGKETNEVITTYQKPTIKESSSIEKTGTEVIKSVDDEITYRFTYTATVNDFVGEGKVTIVDSLPYSVNVANKYLDGGVYDQIAKTITWQEDLGHIDTYLNGEKEINIVKEFTVKYVYDDEEHLSGTITNNVEATLSLTQGDNKVLETNKQASCGTRVEIPAKVIVHHYIYDKENKEYTTVKIAEDTVIDGIIGTEYTTSKADVRKDYTCVLETPEDYKGTMTKSDIEVTYYYELKDTEIRSTLGKEATASKTEEVEVGTGEFNEDGTEITQTKLIPVLTKEDGEVTYKITYQMQATYYIGKVSFELVDTLPYEVDVSKSDFGGGTYNKDEKTITWNEERNVDTFANGTYNETVEKVITVVYVGQDVTKTIVNTVQGNMMVYYPDVHSTKPGEVRLTGQTQTTAEVEQEYKVNKTVEKVWDDNDNLKGRRPDSVTVQLTANEDTSYNGKELEKVVLNNENNWSYTFTNLPKYTDQGFEIKYSVVETETNPGDLEYYDKAKVDEYTNIIRVTNKYKLMNINLESKITNTGTELITSSKDEVNYSIKYTAKVNNYIGEALITIVDTLPYEIDENLSNLNGGIYDKESKTITWKETIDHINTYVNGDYLVDISKDFTVVYSNLDATQRKMTNIANATIDLYETETTNTQATTYDTNMEIPGKVIVKYVDKDSGEEIKSEEQNEDGSIVEKTYGYELDGLAGDEYTTEQKEIYGYTYVENTNNTVGNMTEETITVIYYYVRTDSQGVIVKYVDEDGNEIADSELITGKVKDPYKTVQKDIPNYDFVRVEGNVEGELVEESINVTYIYKKIPAKVIVQYLEKDDTPDDNSDNIILANEQVIEGFSGDSYTTSRVVIDNYQAAGEDPINAEGTMTREDIYVTYYYERKPSGIVTVKYVDIDTNEEILFKAESGEYESYREQLQGLCGLEYTTDKKDIPYYNFVEDKIPSNNKGLYSEKDIEVIYYYTKKEFNLSVEKQIDKITVNGVEHDLKDGLDQIDVVSSKVQETDVIVTYKIIVRNSAEVEGTAVVVDNLPDFFRVTDGTSAEWTQNDDRTLKANIELQPGEEKELIVVLKWIKNDNNFGLQTNTVKLEDIQNPANFEESNTEDNEANAEVMLSVKTGGIDSSIVLGTALIIMLGIFIITIYQKEKK